MIARDKTYVQGFASLAAFATMKFNHMVFLEYRQRQEPHRNISLFGARSLFEPYRAIKYSILNAMYLSVNQ